MADPSTTIATVLSQWEAYGVFDYVLPFLLIFALVYGITTKTRFLGENKMVNTIVSITIGLLALRVGYVQQFFIEFFPRLSVGLSILIGIVILVALFLPEEHTKGWFVGLYSIGAIIALIVVFGTLDRIGWLNGNLWNDWGAFIIGVLLIIGVIIAIVVPSGSSSKAHLSEGGRGLHRGGV